MDIGARRDIGRRARALAAEGAAVLVLSADVDEVLEVADRVVVLAAGEIRLDAYGEDAERDRVIQTISASVVMPGTTRKYAMTTTQSTAVPTAAPSATRRRPPRSRTPSSSTASSSSPSRSSRTSR